MAAPSPGHPGRTRRAAPDRRQTPGRAPRRHPLPGPAVRLAALAAYVREPVVIRYDPRDIAQIRVFHKDQAICTAVDPDHAGQTIGLKDIQAARAAHRRAVRDGINQCIATVATYLPDTAAPARPVDDNPPRPPRRRLRTYYEDP